MLPLGKKIQYIGNSNTEKKLHKNNIRLGVTADSTIAIKARVTSPIVDKPFFKPKKVIDIGN